jgi:hypothetical protein
MSGRWSEEQTTMFVNMYKDSENLWNVFTPEYKNREARLASLEHVVREMNIPNRSRPVELVYCLAVWTKIASPTVYPVAARQLGIQLLSNWLASNWHRVNRPSVSPCESVRGVGEDHAFSTSAPQLALSPCKECTGRKLRGAHSCSRRKRAGKNSYQKSNIGQLTYLYMKVMQFLYTLPNRYICSVQRKASADTHLLHSKLLL